MGRWAQAKKRGSDRSVVAFPIAPPSDEDWNLSAEEGGEVFANNVSAPGEAIRWAAQFTVGDIGSPALPWNDDGDDEVPAQLNLGSFGSFRIWARVRWLNADDEPISDWSNPQFIDVA